MVNVIALEVCVKSPMVSVRRHDVLVQLKGSNVDGRDSLSKAY